MRLLRCDGSSSEYVPDGGSERRELTTALALMESIRLMLVDKRDALRTTGAAHNPMRQRLLAALEANGCNAEAPRET